MSGDTSIRLDSVNTSSSDYVTGTIRKGIDGSQKKAIDVNVVDSFEHAHYQVHRSNFWSVSKEFINAPTTTGSSILLVTGPNNIHIGFGFASGADFRYELIEGITVSANGTTITAFNNNRSAPTATSVQWFSSPTAPTLGTTIFSSFVPGGDRTQDVGGIGGGPIRGGSEWILAENTKYLFKVVNLDENTQTSSLMFGYYEGH